MRLPESPADLLCRAFARARQQNGCSRLSPAHPGPTLSPMARVMAVSFERYGRLYYLDPADREYAVGDRVLVPTESGPEVAECGWGPGRAAADAGFADPRVRPGPAEDVDVERDADIRRKRAQAKLVAKKLI